MVSTLWGSDIGSQEEEGPAKETKGTVFEAGQKSRESGVPEAKRRKHFKKGTMSGMLSFQSATHLSFLSVHYWLRSLFSWAPSSPFLDTFFCFVLLEYILRFLLEESLDGKLACLKMPQNTGLGTQEATGVTGYPGQFYIYSKV